MPRGPYVTFLVIRVWFPFACIVHRPSIFYLKIVERAYENRTRGWPQAYGAGGGGEGKGDNEKKNVFPFSFFLSVSFLFCFFSAFRDHSRALTKLSKIRRISVNSLDLFNLFNLSHVVYETNCLSLTSIHRKFADHRLSLRLKTKHRPTSNPIKKLMSRDDIRSELWV